MVATSITSNINALQIIHQLGKTNNKINTNLARLSTGLRINNAKDDPGSYVLSNRINTQFRGLSQASKNTQDLINLTSTGLDATDQIIALLNDIRDSAVAASGGSVVEQAVIEEKLEELNRIASKTRYTNLYLLNGSLTSNVDFKKGTRDFGASLIFGPNSATLLTGRSYLNIGVVNKGSAQIQTGGDVVYNTGVSPSTDKAVTAAQFMNGGAAAAAGAALSSLTANRVSLSSTNLISYSGYLANGTTAFSGALSVTGSNTVQDLIDAIQSTINAAETKIGVNGTGKLETTVGLTSTGRLQFTSGSSKNISQFDINLSVQNASDVVKTNFGVTHDASVYNSQTAVSTTGASIGNNFTAITGSTFDTGTFSISVSNVVAAGQNQIQTDSQFESTPGVAALSTTNINGSLLNGLSLSNGDTFQINGTDPDGSTFTTTYTVGVDTGAGDGLIDDYASLIDELKTRDRSLASYGFNGAVATLSSGSIRLYDDVANESSTNLQIVVTSVIGSTKTVNSSILQAGSRETATLSLDGGAAQTVSAGQVVTLQGTASTGGQTPSLTFRAGNSFTAGSDQFQIIAQEYIGTLNNGAPITFQNGDQAVRFESGTASIYPIQRYQQVTMDFDAVLDITSLHSSGGETFVISSTSKAANFQIGGDRGDQKEFLFADLRSQSLGTSSAKNLDSINVTTASGATHALTIIDDALDQVNEFAGRLGAFSSRLDSTVATLDSGVLNLETAYTQIVSADIAQETTSLAMNAVLIQAQSAILVQATALPQAVLKILFEID